MNHTVALCDMFILSQSYKRRPAAHLCTKSAAENIPNKYCIYSSVDNCLKQE